MITLNQMPDNNLGQIPVTPQVAPPTGTVPPPAQPVTSTVVQAPTGSGGNFLKIALIIVGIALLALGIFIGARTLLSRFGTGGQVTLTWWGLWEDASVVSPLIAEYEASHPKVKINYVMQSHQDYRERLTNSLAKGEGPDIFRFHNSWVPMFRKELDYLPPSVMSPSEYSQTFYPVVTSDLTSGTGMVGIPLEYDGLVLYINQEIFDQNAKSPPTTWDDLRQTAISLTKKDEQGTITQAGVALGRVENVDHWQEILGLMMLQNGVSLENPTGKLAEDALTFFSVFSSVDGVWDATLPPSTAAFAAGKLAMYFGPSWRTFEIKIQNPNLKFKTFPVPQLPKTTPNEPDISYASYWVEGVWARSKNKAAAWDFLKFMSQKDSLEKLYQNEAKVRQFGEPYPRADMASLLSTDPILGALMNQAPDAQSWYLQSRTFDGPTGINSQISKYFEDAVNAVNSGTPADKALETVVSGVSQVLSQYGTSAK